MAAVPWMPNLKPVQQVDAPTDELNNLENEFRKNVKIFSENMQNTCQHVHAKLSKKGDNHLAHLPLIVQIIQNYLLNLTHKSHLIKGYIFRVYVSKEDIDNKDPKRLLNDDEYLYGDFPAARPFAPLVKELYEKHLTEEEKKMCITFFTSFNQMAEDWLLEGAPDKIFLKSSRKEDKEDGELLVKIRDRVYNMDEKNPTEQQLDDLYELLEDTRVDYIKYRNERVANGATILPPEAYKNKPAAANNSKEPKSLKDTRDTKTKDLKTDPEKKEERRKMAKKIMNASEEDEESEETKPTARIQITKTITKKEESYSVTSSEDESSEEIIPPPKVTKKVVTNSKTTQVTVSGDNKKKEQEARNVVVSSSKPAGKKSIEITNTKKVEVDVGKGNKKGHIEIKKTETKKKEVSASSNKKTETKKDTEDKPLIMRRKKL